MKKILIFLAVILIASVIIFVKYSSYKTAQNMLIKENAEFDQYKDKEVYGIEIATLINKAVDKNTKNKVEKDDNRAYISNNENSIQIEVYMLDNETIYKMEQFYNAGTEQFVQYYGNIKFKCSNIEYHKNTGRVKYVLFEQLQTS